MNKILRLVCRQADFKKIVSIGFFAVFVSVFLSAGSAQASFWNWFNLNKTNSNSQQQATAIVNADTTSSSSTSAKHTATTGSASSITSTSATLNGTVNPKGEEASYLFSYRKSSDASSLTKYAPFTTYNKYTSAGSGSSDVSVSADISGLSSGTTYVYRLYAYSSTTKTTVNGDLKSFTTSGSSSSSSSSTNSSSSSSSSEKAYQLQIKISGAGNLDVTGDASGKCSKLDGKYKDGSICKYNLKEGNKVTLTPAQSPGYELGVWGDACKNYLKTGSCVVTMGKSGKVASVTFNKKITGGKSVTVSVLKTGKGVGKVMSIDSKGREYGGINCGNDCSENYVNSCGDVSEVGRVCSYIYLKAIPDKGSTFAGWSEGCSRYGAKDVCTVSLDGDKIDVRASFNEGRNNAEGKYFDLTVTASAGGVVTSADNRINCGSGNTDCKYSYGKNGTVTLTATPNSGYILGDYSGCSSNTKSKDGVLSCKVKMTKNQKVTINFKASGTTNSSSSTSANHTATTTTGSASSITSTSATLSGTVNPKGNENVYYSFGYSKEGYTGATPNTSLAYVGNNGTSDISFSADISGLSSGTKYNYFIYAWVKKDGKYSGYISGGVKSFTTSGGSSSSSSSSSQTTASTYRLKVIIQGNGRIQDNQSKIDCGSNMTCQANYSKGQVITLKTDDADGSGVSFNTKVDSWSGGGCSGTSNSCEITMDADNKEVTVKFVSK